MNTINYAHENPIDNLLDVACENVSSYVKMMDLTPNDITTISLIFGVLSYFYLLDDSFVIASILFFIAYFFDCLDGFYAKKYKMESESGDYYDHVSDITKLVLIGYALYIKKNYLFNTTNIFIISLLVLLMLMHIGCREEIYNTDNSTSTLAIFKNMCKNKENIKYTRFFGSGTFILVVCIMMIL